MMQRGVGGALGSGVHPLGSQMWSQEDGVPSSLLRRDNAGDQTTCRQHEGKPRHHCLRQSHLNKSTDS